MLEELAPKWLFGREIYLRLHKPKFEWLLFRLIVCVSSKVLCQLLNAVDGREK